ncbi:MAG: hypothetical protein AAF744_01450 [Pseudomonadota bacterium]
MALNDTTYLQAPFNQGAHLNGATNPASAGGACHMFALKWCSRIMRTPGAGAATRMFEMGQNTAEIRVKFRTFGSRWVNEGEERADEGFAKQWGIQVDDVRNLSSAKLISSAIKGRYDQGFIYSFWWGTPAHSIGIYRPRYAGLFSRGYVHVFEPNYGEFYMRKDRFYAWVKWRENSYGLGTVTKHQLRPLSLYAAQAVNMGVKLPGM